MFERPACAGAEKVQDLLLHVLAPAVVVEFVWPEVWGCERIVKCLATIGQAVSVFQDRQGDPIVRLPFLLRWSEAHTRDRRREA